MENKVLRLYFSEMDYGMYLYFRKAENTMEYIVIRKLHEYSYVTIDRYAIENVGDEKSMYKHEEIYVPFKDLEGFVIDLLDFTLSNGREDHEQRVRDYSKFVDEFNMKRFEFEEGSK